MKKIQQLLALFFLLFFFPVYSSENALSLKMAKIDEKDGFITFWPYGTDQRKSIISFFVCIQNVSQQNLYIAQKGNSLGETALSFELKINDTVHIIKRKEQNFTRNWLFLDKMEPTDIRIRPFIVSPEWENINLLIRNIKNEKVMIRACFTQPENDYLLVMYKKLEKYKNMSIWTGTVYSDWYALSDIWFQSANLTYKEYEENAPTNSVKNNDKGTN